MPAIRGVDSRGPREAVLRGDQTTTEVPSDRWNVEDHHDPEPGVPGPVRYPAGARGPGRDIAGFDPLGAPRLSLETGVSDPLSHFRVGATMLAVTASS